MKRLSIFGRLTVGFVAVIAVMVVFNLVALQQLRQIVRDSTSVVSEQYPAIDTVKWLLANLYAQERSDRQYLAVGDPAFLTKFHEEAQEFQRALASLADVSQDTSASSFLQDAQRAHATYVAEFQRYAKARRSPRPAASYDAKRTALIGETAHALQSFLESKETEVATAVKNALRQAERAERLSTAIGFGALVFALALAGVVTFSILHSLRRLQTHLEAIGQGRFRTVVDVVVPRDLQWLTEAIGRMGAKLQELDDLKAEFLSHMTHELRSPMTAVHAGTQLLLEEIPGPLSGNQRQTLKLMEESSRQVIGMISGLLDLAKLDAGMMQYQQTSVELSGRVRASIQKLQLLADHEQIQIHVLGPSGPVTVHGDEGRLQQVLDNLLSNAVKFTPPGGRITVDLKPEGQMLHLTISDTGPGIAPDALPHIFDRFYQGSIEGPPRAPGTGIGLALVKKVVEGHGGEVWAQSEVGRGTTMHVTLPFEPRNAEEPQLR